MTVKAVKSTTSLKLGAQQRAVKKKRKKEMVKSKRLEHENLIRKKRKIQKTKTGKLHSTKKIPFSSNEFPVSAFFQYLFFLVCRFVEC